MTAGEVGLVLVHGAGHSAAIWADVQAALRVPSVAVDLPGRGAGDGELATASVDDAAATITSQLAERLPGDGLIVLVGHSVAGMILPAVVARLGGRVAHLVLVAGITAPEGVRPVDVFLPGRAESVTDALADLRRRHAGRRLEAIDVKDASSIDSLNYATQPMRWHGMPDDLPRTWVRCRRDPIQPPEMQAAFVEHAGAQAVVDIDSGHTPAVDAPVELAHILDGIATTSQRRRER